MTSDVPQLFASEGTWIRRRFSLMEIHITTALMMWDGLIKINQPNVAVFLKDVAFGEVTMEKALSVNFS